MHSHRANESILGPQGSRPPLSWTEDVCSPPGATENKHFTLFKRWQHFYVVPDGFPPEPPPPPPQKNPRRISGGSSCALSDLCMEVTLCKVDFLFAQEVVQVEQLTKQQSGGINKNERINRKKTFQTSVIPQNCWCFALNVRMPDGNSTSLRSQLRASPATTYLDSVLQAAL